MVLGLASAKKTGTKVPGLSSKDFGKDLLAFAFQDPNLLQGLQLIFQSGGDLGDYFLSSKDGKAAAKDNPTAALKVGKGYFNFSKLQADLPGLKTAYQDQLFKETQDTADKLANTPLYASLAKEAKGQFDSDLTKQVDQAYGQLGSYGLGAGAASGFLLDPNKQAQILGPVALQKVQYLKSLQKNAEAQLFGLAGTPNYNTASLSGVGPPQAYASTLGNTAQLFAGYKGFNAGQVAAAGKSGFLGQLLSGVGSALNGGSSFNTGTQNTYAGGSQAPQGGVGSQATDAYTSYWTGGGGS